MRHENNDSHCNKKTMIQVISEPIKQSALLVMVIINKEKLGVKPKADGRHEMKSLRWPHEQQNYNPACHGTSLHNPMGQQVIDVLTLSS